MQEQITPETFIRLRRAFGMMALAMASHTPRVKLKELPSEFSCELVPEDASLALRDRVVSGAVTCIVPDPEPFTFIYLRTETLGGLRTLYGIWVDKHASFYGKKIVSPILTREEAIAKGIPLPDERTAQ